MRLHELLAYICAGFSAVVFAFNVFTPGNPDHLLNLAETLVLTFLYTSTLFMPVKWAKFTHVVLFGSAAGIAVFTDTGFFPSAVMTVSTFILIYAYGGFRTMAAWKLPLSVVLCYGVCLVGVFHYDPPSVSSYSRAAIWTMFISMFVMFLWLVLREIRRQFFSEFAHELIQQNHDLLEELRNLQKRCDDAPQR
jgi:hypothetical protein